MWWGKEQTYQIPFKQSSRSSSHDLLLLCKHVAFSTFVINITAKRLLLANSCRVVIVLSIAFVTIHLSTICIFMNMTCRSVLPPVTPKVRSSAIPVLTS